MALHRLLPRRALADATDGLPMEIAQASVGNVRLRLPSLSCWTITVHVSNVDVALRQKALPEVRRSHLMEATRSEHAHCAAVEATPPPRH